MFTGIVRAQGAVESFRKNGSGGELRINLGALASELETGGSVAVNGVCLTVATLHGACASFDVSAETLSRALIGEWQTGAQVNLEPPLAAGAPLGGHFTAGHVDGVCALRAREDADGGARMHFSAPRELGKFIAHKGSVSVDGVSLTSFDVRDENGETHFAVALIAQTLRATTLGALQKNMRAHLEVDSLARYAHRILSAQT